ncbi:AEC family transporter [Bacillus sp. Marseille-P3661]|uniref:AEC family transporter n=1 Tax=Bacillus sp. Marseille-P3661 TaxID=1936234 RepID=UPI000C86795A|nr:AEC family transporter [Bacillus sp. Marseille-P3661]
MELLVIILPAFAIFLTGFVGQKMIGFDIRSISMAALYLMSPFLAFRTFYTHELTMEFFYIFLFALIHCLSLILIVALSSYFTHASRPQMSAMMLGGAFMNTGNYGAPVVLFAFGAVGFDYAIIMMVFHSFLMNTLGIYFASIGGKEAATFSDSFNRVIRMPVIHGALAGIILQQFTVSIPEPFMGAIDLIANAAIPTVMLVLGMQLAAIVRKKVSYQYVSAITLIRMFVSPALAVLLVSFMPINALLKSVLILQAAMPAAANTTLFAVQFGTEPDLVSFTTLVTTVLSIVTIPIVLLYLGV